MPLKPFLKWAGGKYRLLGSILPALPLGTRLVEPFAGSMAVGLNAPFERVWAADVNADLIGLYTCLQREGEGFIRYCAGFFTPEHNAKEAFMALRGRFNASKNERERSALLLYLNRHAFNGLVRYNAGGGYNVPFGRYKKPRFPLEEMQGFCRRAAQVAMQFACRDFREVFTELRAGDVVYCDPPYAPLSATANFTAYAGRAFGPQEQRELAALALEAAKKGIPVIISNHDTPQTRALYAGASLQAFDVQRVISCKGGSRGKAPELLAVYGSGSFCRDAAGSSVFG